VKKTADVMIDKWVVHPYRALVPEMPKEKLDILTQRTRLKGKQRYAIWTDEQERILDGRAQLRACLAAGVTPVLSISDMADEPAWAVMESITRTHYTGGQCSLIAESLLIPLAVEARDRQRTAGKPLPKELGKGEAVQIAAKAVGKTNAVYVREITRLKKSCPEVIPYIQNGLIPRVPDATKIAAMDEAPRKSALKALDKGTDISLVIDRRKKADDEWNTPEDICEAVRAAFDGEIVCDPCDSEKPSKVKATNRYTKAKDGLKKRWPDRTFVNPPFSAAPAWVRNAIAEASSATINRDGTEEPKPKDEQAKRIYVLLPVRPDSAHQTALLNTAADVLLLADRIAFDKPGKTTKETGRISIMIAGLNISTTHLVDNGLDGMVVRKHSTGQAPDEYEAWAAWLDKEQSN
jgi:hypothetical protein